ncbi:MAG: Ig-like domain-containing protein [Bacteroidales bacterium]|jgi:hypothetical protein|nr:Ig-like domain-containing protein [Bacteroidales bacterium]
MKTKINKWIVASAMLAIMSIGTMRAQFSGAGSGTKADPYQITSVSDLQYMATDLGSHYKLMNDLDLTDVIWAPVGTLAAPFTGSFDGGGNVIRNLIIDAPIGSYIGFFGYFKPVVSKDSIKDLGLDAVSISGQQFVGGITGFANDGTILRCWVKGTLTASAIGHTTAVNLGAIAGQIDASVIECCFAIANISCGIGTSVGGLVGNVSATNNVIANCYTAGSVTSTGYWVGGVVGNCNNTSNPAQIRNCYSSAFVSAGSNIGAIGGIVGNFTGNSTQVQKSVALNKMVLGGGLNTSAYGVGRITGPVAGSSTGRADNYALETMVIAWNGAIHQVSEFSADVAMDKKHGANIARGSVAGINWWVNTLGWDNTIWIAGTDQTTNDTWLKYPVFSYTALENQYVNSVNAPRTYYVRTADDLKNIANDMTGNYVQMANIDLSSEANWTPIGSLTNQFKGTYDGNGYKISNLTIDRSTENFVGLFGYYNPINHFSKIKNVTIEKATIKGKMFVGGLVGYAHFVSLENINITDLDIEGTDERVGGLVGSGTGLTISKCHVEATMIKSAKGSLGGLAGQLHGSCNITGSYVETIDIMGSANDVGGLVGTVNNCRIFSQNYVRATNIQGIDNIGGIVGNISQGLQSLSDNVAINENLTGTATATSPNRILGKGTAVALSNLALSTTITNKTGGVTADSLKGVDGLSKTLVDLNKEATYTKLNWDFNNIWKMGTDFPAYKTIADFFTGSGTKGDPYVITTPYGMNQVRNYLTSHFLLAEDLDMSEFENWVPIGFYTISPLGPAFSGSFNGGGHTISNLIVDKSTPDSSHVALFGGFKPDVANDTIQNLGIVNSKFMGLSNTTSLVAGVYAGTIFNCYSENNRVISGAQAGALVGTLQLSKLEQSWANDSVIATSGNSAAALVLNVRDTSTVLNCYALGYAEAFGNYASGLAGGITQNSKVLNCYSAATVVGKGTSTVANITGLSGTFANATLSNSVSLCPSLTSAGNSSNPVRISTASSATAKARNNYGLISTKLLKGENEIALTADSLNGINGQSITDMEALRRTTYEGLGWDFENVWTIDKTRSAYPIFGVGGGDIQAESVTFDANEISIKVDSSKQLVWEVLPVTAEQAVTFISLDPTIATVDNDGAVKGIAVGTTKIVVHADLGLTDTVDVTVTSSSSKNENIYETVECSIMPNPTKGDVTITVDNDVMVRQIHVYTIDSQLVFSTTKTKFNIEKLQNGMYIIHVISDKGNFVSRIIKW